MAIPPPPPLDRTPSAHARYLTAGCRCFERQFEGQETKPPVKLVVFDCDETLTLSTFMPKDKSLRTQIGWIEWAEFISNVNFESPFADGSRIEKMRECFANLKAGEDGQERTLVILTRNESGAVACLNLLMMAKLHNYFSAIWSMQPQNNFGRFNGCYKNGSQWEKFESPVGRCFDHKADALIDVANHPNEWFPQMSAEGKGPDGEDMTGLLSLKLENIVLVDDVRTNFQSPSPAQPKVLRYCKIARYDSEYREMGLVTNMGGLGARNLDDYGQLEEFVRAPWRFKEAHSIRCSERPFPNSDGRPPVSLVVFDFDETLSIYTFMPEDKRNRTEIGFAGKSAEDKEHFVKFNFQSPYVDGDRVEKLRALLQRLIDVPAGEMQRSLAVLTKNEDGAVAVLNLLLMANLAEYFSVIWTLGADPGVPNGVYRVGTDWKPFPLPLGNTQEQHYKAVVLNKVVESPQSWFPQCDESPAWAHVKEMWMWNIVLVDDERSSFQNVSSEEEEKQVLRYCKVAHYDDEYRQMGLLVHMGGIGAKNDKDYDLLATFVERPWTRRVADVAMDVEDMSRMRFGTMKSMDCESSVELERRLVSEDPFDACATPAGGRTMRKRVTEGKMTYMSTGELDASDAPCAAASSPAA